MTPLLCPFYPPLPSQIHTANRERNAKKNKELLLGARRWTWKCVSGCQMLKQKDSRKLSANEAGSRGDEWGGVVSTSPLLAAVYENIAAVRVIAAVNFEKRKLLSSSALNSHL
ncbi:hypothetical protein OIU77_001836 [Salix suchowensis]|uniref:Uncharacterized protein n=1 Tax=Salix suchowensis TaxID=1278906 RepID=A0ABQ9B2Y9_9ROSI|nr:hypothetical protein OIU77_001836 [Salix suchowensis]